MKKILIIIILFIITACMNVQKVIFINYENENHEEKKTIYKLYVPKNYRLITFQASGEIGAEQQYWYPDSSVVYITSMEGTPVINYINIKRQEGSLGKRFKAFINEDTLTLSGKDEKGFLWKDVKLKNISIGYVNVPPENKAIFEKVLQNINKK